MRLLNRISASDARYLAGMLAASVGAGLVLPAAGLVTFGLLCLAPEFADWAMHLKHGGRE